MIKKLINNTTKYVNYALDKVPGEKTFGSYRFLPIFFIFGASLEFVLINWTVGPNKTNFYTTFKRRQAENIVTEKENLEKHLLSNKLEK